MAKPEPAWTPPELDDLAQGVRVCALDQTLTNCGIVTVSVISDDDYRPEIYQCQVRVSHQRTIRPRTDLVSFAGTYHKALQLDEELKHLISPGARLPSNVRVAFEMPSAGGGHRTESALIAGFIIARHRPDAVMVSAMHVHAVLVGKKRQRETAKKEIAEAVARYVPESAGRSWNEHTRDALAIGLTYLHDLKKELTA